MAIRDKGHWLSKTLGQYVGCLPSTAGGQVGRFVSVVPSVVMVGLLSPQFPLAVAVLFRLDEVVLVHRSVLALLVFLVLPATPSLLGATRPVWNLVPVCTAGPEQGVEKVGSVILVEYQVAVGLRLCVVVVLVHSEVGAVEDAGVIEVGLW